MALGFILQAALCGNNAVSRNCAINILFELFFFTPENGSDELKKHIKGKIADYKDELLKLSHVDELNSNLLIELAECITEDSV